jgi:hypothetical protein
MFVAINEEINYADIKMTEKTNKAYQCRNVACLYHQHDYKNHQFLRKEWLCQSKNNLKLKFSNPMCTSFHQQN